MTCEHPTVIEHHSLKPGHALFILQCTKCAHVLTREESRAWLLKNHDPEGRNIYIVDGKEFDVKELKK
jgi:hypothetical protein